ncbi:unnamed protein product [Kuraishia capsulata CBS 1993]|uniref:Transcription elongation factor Spt6 n=1 Tax=Kuraishia capsulata CBS 1993 TaxID=1382522 RepID=W6MM21_9ASCO|nr:uncharacterized protein KUCA_T00003206001 [Kuraishia capsulata CBS 1993]CDK27228.1 unnamed protein product [Kuraishia capsulata CBS 1993]
MSAAQSEEEREIQDHISDSHSDDENDLDSHDVGNVVDSSEEDEDDDDDPEAIQKVREGFIVDDDDDDNDNGDAAQTKKSRRKRRAEAERKVRDDEELDEDDLELLRENSGALPAHLAEKSKFKRLKRADDSGASEGPRGLTEMFSDEEEAAEPEEEDDEQRPRQQLDEFDGFIEDDEFSEDENRDEEVARMRRNGRAMNQLAHSSIDNDKLGELYEIFGDGEEYDWALQLEEENEVETEENAQPKTLEEVFEMSELKEHLLTEEDDLIRMSDVPERFQALRKGIEHYDLSEEEFALEQDWVANELMKEKAAMLAQQTFLLEPFKASVKTVLEFISRELLEVPFIWSHRRDFLLHTYREDGALKVSKLLSEHDLWRLVELDLEYHRIYEKKLAIQNVYKSIGVFDSLYEEYIKSSRSMVELQDIHDYLSFTYSAEIKDAVFSNGDLKSKKHSKYVVYEKVRADPLYEVVKAVGISAQEFGENVSTNQKLYQTEDPEQSPEQMVAAVVEAGESFLATDDKALEAVKHMYAEQLLHDPRLRTTLRLAFQNYANIDIVLTEKGKVKIDENSPYADFKYAINRPTESFSFHPDLFLRMLEAEQLALVEIKIYLKSFDSFTDHLYGSLASDGTSDVSAAWNTLRRSAVEIAMKKLVPIVSLNVKEKLRATSERLLFYDVREEFLRKVDQAPYQPAGYSKGTIPRVLAVSNGRGERDDAVIAVMIDDEGRLVESVKFEEKLKNPEFDRSFLKVIERLRPDVIAVSGYNVNAKMLHQTVSEVIRKNDVRVNNDPQEELTFETDDGEAPLLEVMWVADETAKLYQHSKRAEKEYSDKPVVARFCVALARYAQSPLLEYIALGEDLPSLSIHKHQTLLSPDRVVQAIETVLVDITNMVGIHINDAVRDPYKALALQYVAGLGARKASGLVQKIQANDGALNSRQELVTKELMSRHVFINCASFLIIDYDESMEADGEPLDSTRIHPEDYDLARKMATDALDLDEGDREIVERERGGVINYLYQKGTEKLDDLIIEEYGDELEKHNQRKRATLQTIKEELQGSYDELRRSFNRLSESEVFRMLTGESEETFHPGAVIPVSLRRVDDRFLVAVTQSLIEGNIRRSHMLEQSDYRSPSQVFTVGETLRAAVISVDYSAFKADLSLLKEDISNATTKYIEKYEGTWDFGAEQADKKIEQNKVATENRAKRVIKHPYFRNLNSQQAEDYLAPLQVGEYVIRPSSKGNNHLVVTWKVDDQLFQHVDVVEHGKATEYSLGRVLQVGEFKYSDLDELLVGYIGSVVQKVEDMVNHEKFRKGTLDETKQWLERYSAANKNRSCYTFCYNRKSPGWFLLLFKLSPSSEIRTWHVKALPTGYSFSGNVYPDMTSLCNGFKTVVANRQRPTEHRRGPPAAAAGYGYGAYSGYGGY